MKVKALFIFCVLIMSRTAFCQSDSVQICKTNYDTLPHFTSNWSNYELFCYRNKLFLSSDTISITDSIRSWCYPVEAKMTSKFGPRGGRMHKGIDIPVPHKTEIRSSFDGKVRYARYNKGGFGNLIIIRHDNGLETYYAHLSKIKVKPNQVVKAGETIGLSGSTGRSYSPHLHFEIRYKDNPINPELIFNTTDYCLENECMAATELLPNILSPIKSLNESIEIYAIKKGDTLSTLAGRYGTTVDQLCKLNGLTRNSILQIGQEIRVN